MSASSERVQPPVTWANAVGKAHTLAQKGYRAERLLDFEDCFRVPSEKNDLSLAPAHAPENVWYRVEVIDMDAFIVSCDCPFGSHRDHQDAALKPCWHVASALDLALSERHKLGRKGTRMETPPSDTPGTLKEGASAFREPIDRLLRLCDAYAEALCLRNDYRDMVYADDQDHSGEGDPDYDDRQADVDRARKDVEGQLALALGEQFGLGARTAQEAQR